MHLKITVLLLSLVACTDLPTADVQVARSVALGAQQARYDQFPVLLFEGLAATCDHPGETVIRPSSREIRCESLLPPLETAGLILEFEGNVRDLPQMVLSVVAQHRTDAYLVTSDLYIRVPQIQGGPRLIRVRDPEMQAMLRELFALTGGEPI